MRRIALRTLPVLFIAAVALASAQDQSFVDAEGRSVTLQPGHPSLKPWLLPADIPAPEGNRITPERVALGEMLFFDARLSVHGQTSCASCHAPERGWGDGFPGSMRFMGERMARNSPTVVNVAFNSLHMWDGRNRTLEQQAVGSQSMTGSLNAGARELGIVDGNLGIERIRRIAGYAEAFGKAYPGEPIDKNTVGKAIATFERSLVSRDTPFDRWARGDATAMTPAQVNGLRVFLDPAKGNCSGCHAAPTFTDNGFHNVGLRQWGEANADVGRFKERALPLMKGAFRTPPLREVAHSAPYFHDGSVARLADVIEHYVRGGDVRTNLSPNMKPLALSEGEKADLLAFLQALSTPYVPYEVPRLPR
ncbi:MAG: tryptophan tryptophylquinone biosynthesis enzyme MauG [Burkholderiales bacterium]|nr:tryptophan tryptophylquinone biosynthesis enzyme MauG [Burkholderiales bacterium]